MRKPYGRMSAAMRPEGSNRQMQVAKGLNRTYLVRTIAGRRYRVALGFLETLTAEEVEHVFRRIAARTEGESRGYPTGS